MSVEITSIIQIASLLQKEIDKLGMGRPSHDEIIAYHPENFIVLYDVLIRSEEIKNATRKLFVDGHYARAVEEAYKCINNKVKDRTQLHLDGRDLMNQAFSEKNPALKLNKLETESERDEQVGYMSIFGGCITGIRNPRAHDHKKTDTPEAALEMLIWANYLMAMVNKAKRMKKSIKIPES